MLVKILLATKPSFKTNDLRSGVYALVNTKNKNCYVGSTIKLGVRRKIHIRQLRRGNHHSIVLQRAFKKYGEESFKFLLLGVKRKKNLLSSEQFWINRLKPAYNINPKAGNCLGRKISDETRKRLSLSHKGHVPWNTGTSGHPSLIEGWRKRRLNGFVVKHSSETRQKMSKAHRDRIAKFGTWQGHKFLSEAHKAKLRRPVLQLLEGKVIREHASVREAAEFVNGQFPNITRACRRGYRASGFNWKYKND